MEQQRGERLRKLFTLVWCFMLKYCQQLVLELPRARYQRSLLLNCWPIKLKLVALFFKSMFGGADVLSNV